MKYTVLGDPSSQFLKKDDIFKIVIQLDRSIQGENYENFQMRIRQVTDDYEHFGARFLRLHNKDKELDFAVDLTKLDQKGSDYIYCNWEVICIEFRVLLLAIGYACCQKKWSQRTPQ